MPTARPRRPVGFGERAFHRWLARSLPAGRGGPLPLGDDAAALAPPRGRVAVVTTDSLVEGTHFLRSSPARAVGRAAAAVSLSDLAAKGAAPAGVLLAVIVPPATPERWAREVVAGSETLAASFGAHVIGGDTKAGPVRTVVGTALGWGRADRLAPRSGGRIGDVLVTTGTVGRGGAAFARGARRPGPRAWAELLDVRPRVREGVALSRWAHAMLDTSDGIAESARLLAAASGVRVLVDEAALPLAPGVAATRGRPEDRRAVAFYGGDYELLAALPRSTLPAAVRAVRSFGGRLTPIGRLARGRGAFLVTGASTEPMPPAGWDPFAPALARSRGAVSQG
ncbi:MAG TPA: thiamine-phosphate kinase [Thermoplasmata archaeon]|nr:thiamine-phosphate kinase [Thermoplasmata archaeon]